MKVDKDKIEQVLSLTCQQRDVIDKLTDTSFDELADRFDRIGYLNGRINFVLRGILGLSYYADDEEAT